MRLKFEVCSFDRLELLAVCYTDTYRHIHTQSAENSISTNLLFTWNNKEL